MERFVSDAILLYLTELLLPNDVQCGFVTKRAPITDLLSVHQDGSTLLDKKQKVEIVLLDLSKAFDVVNHCLILTKMEALSSSPALQIRVANFLYHRQMRVHAEN